MTEQIYVRCVSFGRTDDPYVIGHRDRDELSNGSLEEKYTIYQAMHQDPESDEYTEEFEKFLDWLAAEHQFIQYTCVDEMYLF